MDECFKCGISGEKSKLHDAISGSGIVKVCDRCSIDGDIPVIKRKTTSLEQADRNAPVGGLMKEREKAFEQIRSSRRTQSSDRQEFTLRDLVEKNYKQSIEGEGQTKPGIVRNFNWIILRARRNKGLGQKQLADMVSEPEIAVRMAERGTLPKEYVPFIRKLERVLEVNLMENNPFRLEEHKKMLNLREIPPKEVTVGDLRGMSRKKEIEMIKSKELLAKEQAERESKEAQELLDEPEKVEYEKKRSFNFFKNIFSKKKDLSELEKEESADFSVENQIKEDSKLSLATSSQSKDALKSTSSTSSQSKDALKSTSSTSSQSKDGFKSDSPTPGRTKPVPKYRWQK